MHHENEQKSYIAGIVSILFSTSLVYIVSIYISKNFIYSDNTNDLIELFAVPLENFKPEPLERTLFIVNILIFPIFLFTIYIISNKLIEKYQYKIKLSWVYYILFISSLFLIYYLTWIDLKENNFFYLTNNYFYKYPLESLIFFSAILWLGFVIK